MRTILVIGLAYVLAFNGLAVAHAQASVSVEISGVLCRAGEFAPRDDTRKLPAQQPVCVACVAHVSPANGLIQEPSSRVVAAYDAPRILSLSGLFADASAPPRPVWRTSFASRAPPLSA